MPALDVVLPLLLGFVVLFYVMILFYVWHLVRGEKKVLGQIESFETKLDTQVQQQFQQSLDRLVQSFDSRANSSAGQIAVILEKYQTGLQAIVNQTDSQQQGSFANFTQQLQSVLSAFKSDLSLVQEGVENDLRQFTHEKMQNIYSDHKGHLDIVTTQYQQELENYKKMSMAKTDEMVKAYSFRVLKEVFADSIGDEEHERLFVAALERARKEGLFNGVTV